MKKDDPDKREYERDTFDPSSEIVLGQIMEGRPIDKQNLFEIDNLVIFNSAKSRENVPIGIFFK